MSEKKVSPAPQFIVLAIVSFYAGWADYSACQAGDCLSEWITFLNLIVAGLLILYIGFVRASMQHSE